MTNAPLPTLPLSPPAAQRIVQHVEEIYGKADAAVQRAAREALARRAHFAERDELRIAERPKDTIFGRYILRRKGRKERPYDTMLRSFAPLAGSCNCADFRRASLGLCKHLIVVLEECTKGPRLLQRALQESPPAPYRAILTWDSVRPLHGQGDFLERVRLHPPLPGKSTAAYKSLARLFAKAVRAGAVLRSMHAETPKKRLATVEALASFLRLQNFDERFCEPALAARLQEERTRLQGVLELRDSKVKLKQALRSLETELYPFQEESVLRFLSTGRMMIADDMGLGKTAQAVACGHALFLTGLIKRGLILVPASLQPQWEREWTNFSSAPFALVEGSAKERAALYRKTKAGFLVASYEQVLGDLALMKRWKPDFVVLDEAQRIKNWASKTSHQVKELEPAYRLVLTGAPMEDRLEELGSIFDWVDDHALEPKWRLTPYHSKPARGQRGRNLEALRELLAPHRVRRVRESVLQQLPPRTDCEVSAPLTPEQRAQHEELEVAIAALLNRTGKNLDEDDSSKLMQLFTTQRIIANGLAQLDYGSLWLSIKEQRPSERLLKSLFSPKLIELRELVRQIVLHQGRKVVIFSQWRRMLQLAHWAISDLLEDEGLQAHFFTGAEVHKRRTSSLAQFHKKASARVLFASDEGGVGLNLQRAANALIHLELPLNPAVREQRVSRIHRIGQRGPVDIYHLVGLGSIEERLADLYADQRELSPSLFDGDTNTVRPSSARAFLKALGEFPEGSGEFDAEDSDRELDALLAAADESTDTQEKAPPTPAEVRELFKKLTIQRSTRGRLRIEAPAEASEQLSALFEGMARLLQQRKRPGQESKSS